MSSEHQNRRARGLDVDWLVELVLGAYAPRRTSPEIAVVMAQMAVETCAERTFQELLLHRGFGSLVEPLVECLPDRSLMSPRTRRLWSALTGTELSDAPSWKAYHRHVERRNRVAHAGLRVSADEAHDSSQACRSMVIFMLDALAATTGRDLRGRSGPDQTPGR